MSFQEEILWGSALRSLEHNLEKKIESQRERERERERGGGGAQIDRQTGYENIIIPHSLYEEREKESL